jgi:hypothetical protein
VCQMPLRVTPSRGRDEHEKKEPLHDAFGGVLVESVLLSGVIGYLYNGTERNGTVAA